MSRSDVVEKGEKGESVVAVNEMTARFYGRPGFGFRILPGRLLRLLVYRSITDHTLHNFTFSVTPTSPTPTMLLHDIWPHSGTFCG